MEGELIVKDESPASSSEENAEVEDGSRPDEPVRYVGSLATSDQIEKARAAETVREKPLPIAIQGIIAEMHRQARRIRVASP